MRSLKAIPRHRIETTCRDYARMAMRLLRPRRYIAEIERFEREFASFIGARHAVAVSSGRAGIHLVLKHLGVQMGEEAILPAFNLYAVVERFLALGLRPVFADVDPRDFNLNPASVKQAVTSKTRVLLATHMFGQPCDMTALGELANRHDLILIEDCAHALGSAFAGRRVGTFGKAAIFSLSPLKLITAFGGGVVTTDDDNLAAAIRDDLAKAAARLAVDAGAMRSFIKGALLDVGTRSWPFSLGVWPLLRVLRAIRPEWQRNIMTEVPSPLSDDQARRIPPPRALHPFQATLARSQLARINSLMDRRRRVMGWLDEQLGGMEGVWLPRRDARSVANGLYYGILVEHPSTLADHLFARGIDCETREYCNCAELSRYAAFARPCPGAREVERRILRIPNHPGLTKHDAGRITRAIRMFLDHHCQVRGASRDEHLRRPKSLIPSCGAKVNRGSEETEFFQQSFQQGPKPAAAPRPKAPAPDRANRPIGVADTAR